MGLGSTPVEKHRVDRSSWSSSEMAYGASCITAESALPDSKADGVVRLKPLARPQKM